MYMHQNEYSFINVVQGSNEQHLIDVGPVPGFHHNFRYIKMHHMNIMYSRKWDFPQNLSILG